MQWVLDNWVWILLGGGMVAMHLFGHGGHGGHGSHGKNRDAGSQTAPEPQPSPPPAAGGTEKHRDL
ncbi:MAG TPA: hypothetical protein VGA46_07940 [Methyloceanibacter sp.]|jgi:hypothetical protein